MSSTRAIESNQEMSSSEGEQVTLEMWHLPCLATQASFTKFQETWSSLVIKLQCYSITIRVII